MKEAGFVGVKTAVRHFQASDTPITHALLRWMRPLRNPLVLDRIGRIGGWYVVATGTKQTTEHS